MTDSPGPHVFVLMNHPPHCSMLKLPMPFERATVSVFLAKAASYMGSVVKESLSQVRLRWIVDQNSALSLKDAHEPETYIPWYSTKGRRLASVPIEKDEELREKLLKLDSARFVQLYVVAPPSERLRYRQVLRGGEGDTIRSTVFNPSPSRAAADRSIHRKAQDRAPIYDGRQPLANNIGPHPAIYHPVFAEMLYALDPDNVSQVQLDSDIELLVRGLCDELAHPSVVDEDSYMAVIEKYFPKLFPGCTFKKKYRLERDGKCEAELDFVLTCPTPYGVDAIILAGEAKYRDGNGGSAPTQAIFGYRRIYIHAANQCFFYSTSCPCIILAASGSILQVDAAYFTNAVFSSQMCLQFLTLNHGVKSKQSERLARHFQVLRNAVLKLVQFYGEVHIGAPYSGPGLLLPQPCMVSETGDDSVPFTDPKFTLDLRTPRFTTGGQAIFEGRILPTTDADLSTPVSVYVKFVDQYGDIVHKTLYEAGFAPTLRWCGPVCGGCYTMVVMDKVEGKTVQEIPSISNADLTDLDAALAVLLEENMVHGDLRPPNVILSPGLHGRRNKAYLIDFDWAGTDGEVRYPANLNPRILWPPGVISTPYSFITRAHDEFMRANMLLQEVQPKKMLPWMRSFTPEERTRSTTTRYPATALQKPAGSSKATPSQLATSSQRKTGKRSTDEREVAETEVQGKRPKEANEAETSDGFRMPELPAPATRHTRGRAAGKNTVKSSPQ